MLPMPEPEWDKKPGDDTLTVDGTRDIRRIRKDCIGSSYKDVINETKEDSKAAVHIFSINPTFFVAKEEDETALALQPALLVGFFRELLSVGFGVNMTGKDRGDVFMVLGIGTNFD